jgi:hypothetical protein
MEQFKHWTGRYALMARGFASNYTDKAYNTFPRYNALSAILHEIEKLDADNLPAYDQLSDLLISAGERAVDDFIRSPSNLISANAIAEEKEKFAMYISSLSEDSIEYFDPLPYRRSLSDLEVENLWQKIDKRWGTKSVSDWYPLVNKTEPSLHAFKYAEFTKKFSDKTVRKIIRSLGNHRLYELREFGDCDYFISLDLWEPCYGTGGEGFWVSEGLNWILYASHEGTITVGGLLKDELLKLWPDAPEFSW